MQVVAAADDVIEVTDGPRQNAGFAPFEHLERRERFPSVAQNSRADFNFAFSPSTSI